MVSCLAVARTPGGAGWWPRVAALVLSLSAEREAAIPKADSRVLRFHTRQAAGPVGAFVEEHAAGLPAVAVRETRTRLRSGARSSC